MKYIIKNKVAGNLNLPQLKMSNGESMEVETLTNELKDYYNRGYITVTLVQ